MDAADMQAFVDSLATPPVAAEPGPQAVIYAIREVAVLSDDRVGAFADLYDPFFPADVTFYYLFAKVGDRWLVDDTIGVVVPDEATP